MVTNPKSQIFKAIESMTYHEAESLNRGRGRSGVLERSRQIVRRSIEMKQGRRMLTRGLLKQIGDCDEQTYRGKQIVIDEGESQKSRTKSRKRKRNASHCTCPRRHAKTEKPPLPEGYGYVPIANYADENGHYSPEFSDKVRYMSCRRCGIDGDHWAQFCRNPIYDPSEKEGAAPNLLSWKYILGNFNVDEYLEEQKHKSQGEPEPPSEEDSVPRKCIYCRNRTGGNTEKPPLPEGYGYVPIANYADENGHYSPEFSDKVHYMTCRRCGIDGDHWAQFCRNPIYDPPEKEGAAPNLLSWKYILGNFNVDEYLEEQKHKSQVKPEQVM